MHPQDLEDLQLRMLREMLTAGMGRTTYVVGLDERGNTLNKIFNHSGHEQSGGPFFTTTVAMVALDIRQVAMAKTLTREDEGSDNDLAASVRRFSESQEKAYQIVRDHRQTGEKLYDRAVVAVEDGRAQAKLQDLHNNIANDIIVLADRIAQFASTIGTLLERPPDQQQLDQQEKEGSAIVQMGLEIAKKLEDPALVVRGSQNLTQIHYARALVTRGGHW